MRITAHGRNRVVYTHTVADAEVKAPATRNGKVSFSLNSKNNPGIGAGQYVLNFELDKSEIEGLFEAAMRINTDARISELESEIKDLKRALSELSA